MPRLLWRQCGTLSTKEREHKADRRVAGEPRISSPAAHLAVKRAYTAAFGETPQEYLPAKSYLDWRVDGLEAGIVKPEPWQLQVEAQTIFK